MLSRIVILIVALAFAPLAQAAPDTGAGRTAQRITSADSYVPMPTVVVAIPNRGGVSGMLNADFGLDVPDPKLRARITGMAPRLRDAFRSAVSDYASGNYRPGTAPDPVRLAVLLQAAADRTLGQTGARILMANVIVLRSNQ